MPGKSGSIPKPMPYQVFLLKTIYFSPITNTLYPLLGAMLAVLAASGGLTKHNMLLALYATGLTGFVIGPFLCIREPGGRFRLNPSILLLPMHLRDILKKTFLSSVLYGSIINVVLLAFMALQLGMPFVQNPGIDFIKTPGGATLPVATGIVWDVDGRTAIPYNEVLYPSLIFGIVKSVAGFPVFPAWPLFMFLFFTAMTAYFSIAVAFKPFIRQKPVLQFLHRILLACYALIGIVIAADVLIDTDTLWRWRSALDAHAFILPIIAFGLFILFAGGIVLQYQQGKNQVME